MDTLKPVGVTEPRPKVRTLGSPISLWILAAILPLHAATQPADARQVFERGQQALNSGDLTTAEKAFRQVLEAEPNNVGAHGNLAVVYMRRREWKPALAELRAAERLAPNVPGIRLNIGLAYFRQADYPHAIPPFESVVRDQPDATQARYLLGLCYFFTERYPDTVQTLQPLWPQESGNLNYLYVVAIAAGKAGRTELDQQATAQLIEVGKDSAELHLLTGKAHVAHAQDDQALAEFAQAARIDPKQPFVHYFLGTVYRRRNDLERAKQEFLKDTAIEPDVAYDYDQLGAVCYALGQIPEAERYFKDAVRLDPSLGTSHFGLAKIYKEQGKYAEALKALDAAVAVDPQSSSVHYLRGQVLAAMDRRTEARSAFDESLRLKQATRDELERKISGQHLSDPQLASEER
jgi:tetratricopeptide (TPR) repeat protein